MHTLYPIVKVNGGEWSPSMDFRLDLPNFRSANRKMRNVIPMKQGGATRRPGSVFMGNGFITLSGATSMSRMEPFEFAPGTTFMLEFKDQGIRFYSNGAQVTVPGTPATWVTATNYPAGAYVTYPALGVIFYLYNGPLTPSSTNPLADTTHWRQQTAYEVPVPYSGINYTAPFYSEADIFGLDFLQVNDVVYITHPNFPVWKLTRYGNTNWVTQQVGFLTPAMMDENATDETMTASATTGAGVSLTAAAGGNWATSTYYVPGNTVLKTGVIYSCVTAHTSGTFLIDLANGVWTVVTNFVAGHVGSEWQLAYNRPSSFIEVDAVASGANYIFNVANSASQALIGTWEIQTYGTWNANVIIEVSYDNGTTWQIITTLTSRGDANYSISGQELNGGLYRLVVPASPAPVAVASTTPPRFVLTADNQFVYGLVQITAVTNAYLATCTVITPLFATTATQFWSEGAWSTVRGYPTSVTIFQERAWYGFTAAEPQRVWGTQTDDLENFALIDQSQATYGLAFDLNAPGRGPGQWLAAQADLFVGLSGAEWVISSGAGTSSAITPSAVQALEESANGSAPNLPGRVIGNAVFYVQRKGRSFQQMLFSVFTTKYMSTDMQVTSQHLTNSGIVQFDYQQQFEEQSIIWAVCGDGSLISMTYAMDQEVFAWAKHTTGDTVVAGQSTDFGFTSVAVIYGANGADDEVWVSVVRSGGVTIERLNPVDWQTANTSSPGQPFLGYAVYADCATIFAPTTGSGNVFTPSAGIGATNQLLWNRTLVASIVPSGTNGAVSVRNLVVSNAGPSEGTITIPNYVPITGDTVVIGLPINWAIQPMRLDVDPRIGPIPGLTKSIAKLYPRMLNSIGGQWSTTSLDGVTNVQDIQQYPITQNTGAPLSFNQNVPQEVELDVGGLFGYENDPQFTLQGFDPLPFTLLGIAIKLDIAGTP